jgi:hypothetical protein
LPSFAAHGPARRQFARPPAHLSAALRFADFFAHSLHRRLPAACHFRRFSSHHYFSAFFISFH